MRRVANVFVPVWREDAQTNFAQRLRNLSDHRRETAIALPTVVNDRAEIRITVMHQAILRSTRRAGPLRPRGFLNSSTRLSRQALLLALTRRCSRRWTSHLMSLVRIRSMCCRSAILGQG